MIIAIARPEGYVTSATVFMQQQQHFIKSVRTGTMVIRVRCGRYKMYCTQRLRNTSSFSIRLLGLTRNVNAAQ
jgi:hypothetical protein